ncbi:MAG: hypothetical protein HY819_04895 [Acidobacteria bacterium]|nr:hypothetical protein [Acidobacteriota bacterium]
MADTDGHNKKYPRMDLEDKDIDVGAIIKFTIVLLITTVIIYIAAVGLFKGFEWWEEYNSPPLTNLYKEKAKEPPKPLLQTNVTQYSDLKDFRAKEAKILKDGDEAIKKIPVDQAIDKLLEKGLPTRPQAEAENFLDKAEKMPSDQSGGSEFERRLR